VKERKEETKKKKENPVVQQTNTKKNQAGLVKGNHCVHLQACPAQLWPFPFLLRTEPFPEVFLTAALASAFQVSSSPASSAVSKPGSQARDLVEEVPDFKGIGGAVKGVGLPEVLLVLGHPLQLGCTEILDVPEKVSSSPICWS